ncbi:MAG: gamma-glutamylcyclotransferase family protein [Parahaliea sp.]
MEHLFSYGTLQLESVQLETFGRRLEGVGDTLQGYIVGTVRIRDTEVIRKSGKEFHPILKHTGNPTDEVVGTIFNISSEELAQADEYEVEEYARTSTRFKSGQTAWLYVDATEAETPAQPD